MPLNRLRGSRCYLCGPIDRATDFGHGWRDVMTPKLESMGVEIWNPLKKPFDSGLEDDDSRKNRMLLKREDTYDKFSEIMEEVVRVDRAMVNQSSFLLTYLDLDIFPFGTIDELFIAAPQKKPVVLVCKQGKSMCPDYCFGMMPHQMIFSSFDEAHTYLQHIDNDEVIDTMSRWIFFKKKMLRLS